MKYAGVLLILFGIWLTAYSWNDPVEGRTTRPIGVLFGVVGLFLMLEGFKREIIRDVRRGGPEN